MNLVEAWMIRAKEKYDSIAKAVKFLNMVCGEKLQAGSVYLMKYGKRDVPPSVQNMMVNDTLFTSMEKAGYDPLQGNFEMLRDSLSLPNRRK